MSLKLVVDFVPKNTFCRKGWTRVLGGNIPIVSSDCKKSDLTRHSLSTISAVAVVRRMTHINCYLVSRAEPVVDNLRGLESDACDTLGVGL